MASAVDYAATPLLSAVSVGSSNVCTSRATATNSATLVATGASSRRIEAIQYKADGDPADSVIFLWHNDGSTTRLFDEIDIGNPGAGSNTAASLSGIYLPLTGRLLLPATHSLLVTITVAPTSGSINLFALGASS